MRVATINNSMISKGQMRMEGKFFLNETSLLCMPLERNADKCVTLETVADVMNPPVFKRQFCSPTERAVQYFQSSDVNIASESSSVFVYKPQAERIKAIVHKGDILVTGFGTIGNARLISRHQDGVCYANNVARIRTKGEVLNGYIYAFMASKYGSAQLNKNASGSVVRYIEAPGIKKVLIPNTRVSFQQEVDDLIQKSARLREEATDALDKAHTLLHSAFNNKDTNIKSVSIKKIYAAHNQRFEASYYVSNNRNIYDSIVEEVEFMRLKDLCTKIFRPGIFKRQYVTEGGITFLGGADILNAIPSSYKQLSKPQVKRMPELMPKQGTILVTCGGTIGNTVYVDNQLATCAVSQHVMRLVPNGEVHNGYLYAFLSSEIGKKLINLFAFGSVIPQIEAHHLELIPVPILDDETMNSIDALCMQYVSYNEIAKEKERKAISMVEAEIESWTTSKKN
ncbi:hypothetical protein F0475_05445 [Prevotella sp. A2879]|jgi:Restriction endonuclease S subunits|uniref:Type I restriction modification DNA specificity domain-containing protein n=1 Tax=Prevotella vespertina TaxID=2608404 RepID=A0A7C9LT83_9BACT|nr:restriction endonuclease subunit S [Prevotella vespertina]MUL27759.1 hypothetical protein [Prevotella vespertina]